MKHYRSRYRPKNFPTGVAMRIIRVSALSLLCLALAAPMASARKRDHLTCYKAATEFVGTTTHLGDVNDPNNPGGANTFIVKKAKDYCVPTVLNNNAVLDDQAPWVLFSGKRAKGECAVDSSVACSNNTDCTSG